jgi:hypothetical protein
MTLSTPKHTIIFDNVFHNGSGRILGIKIPPYNKAHVNVPQIQYARASVELANRSHATFHQQLGHPNDQIVRKTAPSMCVFLSGTPQPCTSCALCKSQRKAIPKQAKTHATTRGYRLAIDLSSTSTVSFGGAKFWLLIQDEFTGHIWSLFLAHKSELPEIMLIFLRQFQKDNKLTVHNIRCDNSGENLRFKRLAEEDTTLSIKFELTAPYTPEQNGKLERKYATLYGKVRAMLNHAQLPTTLRHKLWAQCAHLAT